jgi:hypothetical protein
MSDISPALLKKISPATTLPGCGLLIIASGRLSHAIVAAGALVWVYGLTSLVIYAAVRLLPRQGRTILISFLASFMAALYLFILWLLSPLCALETFFAVSLVPVFYMASGVSSRADSFTASDSFFLEALSLCVLLLAFALIREPLGFVSLSMPGGSQGSVMLFSFNAQSFFFFFFAASSGGALLLLGYFFALYNYNRAGRGDKNAK